MSTRKAFAVVTLLAVAGLGTAVTQASAAPSAHHGMGLDLAALKAARTSHRLAPAPLQVKADTAPASFDLTEYAPQPGDQGQVGSCVTWATGYTGYGLLMKEQGITGAPMAPMFIYAQIAKGNDQGTYAARALSMEKEQGIDTKAHYWQGDFDYTTQPDQSERTNAAAYKLSGYTELPSSGTAAKQAIKDAISQGLPVPIGFTVHQSFMDLTSTSASNYTYLPGGSGDKVVGGHEVTIVAYNEKGVKIENSWGLSWGARGFATVPWSFFDTGDVDEIHSMGKLVQA